jgi:hypothetical protein
MKHLFCVNRVLFFGTLALGISVWQGADLEIAHAAGDVGISIDRNKGKVNLEGDFDSNDITITQSGNEITIKGNASTKIDGEAEVKINVTDITGPDDGVAVPLQELRIRLRGGDDTIQIDGLNIQKLEINDDIDNNTTIIQNSTIGGKLKIQHGDGTDTVKIKNTTWGEKDIKTKGGGDTLDIQASAGDKTSANLGAGDDALFADTLSSNTIKFTGGNGMDCFEFFNVTGFDKTNVKGFELDGCDGDGACAHDPCEVGAALASDCDATVTAICTSVSSCCTSVWDSLCVSLYDSFTGACE